MSSRSRSRAHASTSARRSGDSTPPSGCEWARGDDRRVGVGAAQRGAVDPVGVRRHRDDLEAGAADRRGRERVARVLDADAAHAALRQHVENEPQPAGVARGRERRRGRGQRAAHAAEVLGERRAQPRMARGRPVAELRVGDARRARCAARRPQARRGNSDRSGLPGKRSMRGAGAAPAGAARWAAAVAPGATRVPEPCRATRNPSATSCP